jgi:hypothetical protein
MNVDNKNLIAVLALALIAVAGSGCGMPAPDTQYTTDPEVSTADTEETAEDTAETEITEGTVDTEVPVADAEDAEDNGVATADTEDTEYNGLTTSDVRDSIADAELTRADGPVRAGDLELATEDIRVALIDTEARLGGAEVTRTDTGVPVVEWEFPTADTEDTEDSDDDGGGFHISLPERFVMASVPNGTPGLLYPTLEVRVSPDGVSWSAPSYPLTVDCGLPIPVDWNIAPGLAASATHYLVAAYGMNGRLYFSKSRNGVEWTTVTGTTWAEPGLGPDSRPSVVYDYDEDVWYALIVTEGANGLDVSFMDLDGVTTQFAHAPILNFQARRSPSIAYTGASGKRYTIARSFYNSGAFEMSFHYYEALPFDIVDVAYPFFQQNHRFGQGAATTISGTLGQIFLATSNNVPAGNLVTGVNKVWRLDPYTDEWSPFVELGPAAPDHEGPALAGVGSNMVVGSPGRNGKTDVWHVWEDSLGVPRAEHGEVRTRSIKQVGLAFGPKNGRAELSNECSSAPELGEPLKRVSITFRRFKRTIPPLIGNFNATEDVELTVEHKTRTGFVDRRIGGMVVEDATENQPHFFNEGQSGAALPRFEILMQPTEVVRVTLEGDDGRSTVDLTLAELSAPQTGGTAKLTHTRYRDGSPAYLLWYDAGASPAQ